MSVRFQQFVCIVAVAASASAALAQSPFFGDWKMNNEKSHLTGDIVQFSPAPDGAIKYTANDRSYTFKTDGKEYNSATASQNIWKKTDDNNYERSTARNGSPLAKATYKISSDGKTMVEESTGTRPDGQTFDNTTTYTRVAGAKGLMGSWKDAKVDLKEDRSMVWKAGSSPDTMRWELPQLKAYADISLDGKEAKPVGPTVPKGLTVSLMKTGPESMTMVERMDGKLLFKNHYKISADGKTMTEIETPPDGKAPATIVYEKQM